MKFTFIGGAQRSGTTLLHSIVCSTRATPPPTAEDGVARYIALAFEDTLRRFDQHASHFFKDREEARQFFRKQLRSYILLAASRWPDATHMVLKQPLLTPHFPTLAKLLPRAQFIIAVRDPRDVVASLLEVAARESDALGKPSAPRTRMRQFTRQALYFYDRPLADFGPKDGARHLWVRYEDMVRAPEATAERLGAFTGIDLSGYQSGEPWRGWGDGTVDLDGRKRSPYFSPLWGQPVTQDRIGAWRTALTDVEASRVAQAASDLMQAFGYGDDEAAGMPTTTK